MTIDKESLYQSYIRGTGESHTKEVKSTRTEHICNYCQHDIEIGSPAAVETIITQLPNDRRIFKTFYYHSICHKMKTYNQDYDYKGATSNVHTTKK